MLTMVQIIPLPGSSTRLQCLLLRDSTASMQLEGPAGSYSYRVFGAYSPKLALPIWVYVTEFPGLNICGPSSQIMLLMFLSNCYPFHLLLLLPPLYCFWLLIPRISCLIQKVNLGSLRSLFSRWRHLYVSFTEHNHCQLLFPRQSFIL